MNSKEVLSRTAVCLWDNEHGRKGVHINTGSTGARWPSEPAYRVHLTRNCALTLCLHFVFIGRLNSSGLIRAFLGSPSFICFWISESIIPQEESRATSLCSVLPRHPGGIYEQGDLEGCSLLKSKNSSKNKLTRRSIVNLHTNPLQAR